MGSMTFCLVSQFHALDKERLFPAHHMFAPWSIDTIFSKKTSKSAYFLKFNYGVPVISQAYFSLFMLIWR